LELSGNRGSTIVPRFTVRSPVARTLLRDVQVATHNVLSGVPRPQGGLRQATIFELTWYERFAAATRVRGLWSQQFGHAEASATSGFGGEIGMRNTRPTPIHHPPDMQITVFPDYALWRWLWLCCIR